MADGSRLDAMHSFLRLAWLCLLCAGLTACADPADPAESAAGAAATEPSAAGIAHVGSFTCASCHAGQHQAWSASHHHQAMQEARPATVLGDFADAQLTHGSVTSHFFRRGERFFVRTDGPDGTLQDFPIEYTFGVYPLQQYLVAFPGGRLQPLPLAWDARSAAEGGQRWFHLYPHEHIDHRDPLHWTGRVQNWNHQCAACHVTDVRKRYDEQSDTYATSFSELGVGCEACHGAGSRHVALARSGRALSGGTGLLVRFEPRSPGDWRFASDSQAIAGTMRPARSVLLEACAACHARRSVLREGAAPGTPLHDAYRPALPAPPLYHADGQQREEVFTWGSFAQSKMHARGVDCGDCHEPHSLRLRAEGDALCGGCHRPSVYDTRVHERHPEGVSGSRCVDCHMPATNYMVVDARRDHRFGIPRPDLTRSSGPPNACNQCHADRSAEWSANVMDRWYGSRWRSRPSTAAALAQAQVSRGTDALLAIADDRSAPAVLRATALASAGRSIGTEIGVAAERHLRDGSSLVRAAAAGLLANEPPAARARALAPLLSDPVLGVRVEAARLLADVADGMLGPASAARSRAATQYLAAEQLDADQPRGNVNLAIYLARSGRFDAARERLERAVRLEPAFVPAYLILAEVLRMEGRDDLGETALRRGLTRAPDAADLRHGLGLLLVRRQRHQEALLELRRAHELDPASARYTYVYGVALHSSGSSQNAIEVLEAAARRFPDDQDILAALVAFHREAGNEAAARRLADRLESAEPR